MCLFVMRCVPGGQKKKKSHFSTFTCMGSCEKIPEAAAEPQLRLATVTCAYAWLGASGFVSDTLNYSVSCEIWGRNNHVIEIGRG